MRLIATALTIAVLSTPLLAADPNPAASTPKEKRVCREKRSTGSRLSVRTCKSQSEWDAIDREQQEHADREVSRIQAMGRSDGTGFNPN